MKNIEVERIQYSVQGLWGLLDVLYDDFIFRRLETGEVELSVDTFSKLLQSAKVLARQLNVDTQYLDVKI